MPDTRIVRHCPALAAEHDVRGFASQTFYKVVGADTVSVPLPTYTEPHWDAVALLNGYGSRDGQTLSDVLNLAWSAAGNAGTLTAKINEDTDFFQISIAGGNNISLEADSGSEDHALFGFPTAGLAAAATLTATGPWRRGIFMPTGGIRITQSGGSTVSLPSADYRFRKQSLPTWIRERGLEGDNDDVWDDLTLEDAIEAQTAAAGTPFTALVSMQVEADGHCTVDVPSADTVSLKSTDDSCAFWRTFGFDGTETFTTHGNRKYIKSTYPVTTFFASPAGYVEFRRFTEYRDNHALMANASVVTAGLAPYQGFNLTLRAHGPARGPSESQEKHLRHFMQHVRRRVTFYPQWRDLDYADGSIEVRRHRDLQNAVLNVDKYGKYHTTEADTEANHYARRKGGRLLMRIHPKSGQMTQESYTGQQIDAYQDLQFKLLDDTSRPVVDDDRSGTA